MIYNLIIGEAPFLGVGGDAGRHRRFFVYLRLRHVGRYHSFRV